MIKSYGRTTNRRSCLLFLISLTTFSSVIMLTPTSWKNNFINLTKKGLTRLSDTTCFRQHTYSFLTSNYKQLLLRCREWFQKICGLFWIHLQRYILDKCTGINYQVFHFIILIHCYKVFNKLVEILHFKTSDAQDQLSGKPASASEASEVTEGNSFANVWKEQYSNEQSLWSIRRIPCI